MLLRLVYVSTLAEGVSAVDVDAIVAHSKVANERRGVTGMLALEDRRVCQILEGDGAVVDGLYRVIEGDERHNGISLLDRRAIDAPHFGQWGMRRSRMVDVVTLAFSL